MRKCRFYAQPDGERPALITVREGGGVIAWGAWGMPTSQFGIFVAGIPARPGIGKRDLADESVVNGFVREGY